MFACLLPARNAAADIPDYLESAARFADTVIALDDGSTDSTAQLLSDHRLVERLLRNPARETYAGWDDSANRQRLLDAAIELNADWVLFLDADERIDADDGEALRGFVGSDALAGCAYGFPLYRTWGKDSLVAAPSWVYRMFAPRQGQQLGAPRLHFNPIPEGIPAGARIRTTVRIRHLDSPARLAARRAKYAEADPGSEFAEPSLLGEPVDELEQWRSRPSGLAVLAPWEAPQGPSPAPASRPRLACLLPARNAAADIPDYLESAARFADTVIALDDGSTDSTAQLLSDHRLVERLLRNPARETYAGWDDSANRQRLLDAAIELNADWVLFLDADERIDADDGEALRGFVDRGADPGEAYGFRVFRIVGEGGTYDRAGLWAYRLFAPNRGAVLPDQRLHLVPVPQEMSRKRWRRTTIRIQHLGGATRGRREARYRKYLEADPQRRFQHEYRYVLDEGLRTRPWQRRPEGMPVLADPLKRGIEATLDLERLDLDGPVLSAVIISRDDEATIARSVRAAIEQDCPEPFEVIVVVSGTNRTAQIVRERFPDTTLIELPEPALPGEARNAGLAAARGDYVSFPGSHVELVPGSLAARVRAHQRGFPLVTGSALNGTRTRAGWAAYFIDHSSSLPDRPSGELSGAPARCSYERELLLELGGFPEDMRAGEDTVVNNELARRRRRAYRERDAQFIHHNPCATAGRLFSHHFRRGRAHGRILLGQSDDSAPLPRRSAPLFLANYARRRLRDTDARVSAWGSDELQRKYRRVRPLVIVGLLAAATGAGFEVLRPGRLS